MPELVCRVIDCHVFRRTETGPRYLLMKRSAAVVYAGSWRMVGGKIEAGEKAWQTALRELKEETGLAAVRLWAVPYTNQFYEADHDRVNIIPVFAAEVKSEAVRLEKEHDEFRWTTWEEAKALLSWPAQIEGLRIVSDFIVNGSAVASFTEIRL